MKRAILIAVSCLVMASCGPSEDDKPKQTGKEFMRGFGECPDCGKRKIELFRDHK